MDQEWLVRLALGTDSTELESLKRYSEFVKFHKQLSKSQMSFLVRGKCFYHMYLVFRNYS